MIQIDDKKNMKQKGHSKILDKNMLLKGSLKYKITTLRLKIKNDTMKSKCANKNIIQKYYIQI